MPVAGTYSAASLGTGGRDIGPGASAQIGGFIFNPANSMIGVEAVRIDVDSVTTSGDWIAQIWSDNGSGTHPSAQIGSSSNVITISAARKSVVFFFSNPPVVTLGILVWVIFRPNSGTPEMNIDTAATQAGFGAGRNNTVTSIGPTDLPNSECWRVEVTSPVTLMGQVSM